MGIPRVPIARESAARTPRRSRDIALPGEDRN